MAIFNSDAGYGALTKLCHWAIAALFVAQYGSALVMLRTGADTTTLGASQGAWFNAHKSLGLAALALAVVRLWNRRQGSLPPWAPTLSALEQAMIHRAEQLLYAAMLVMPLSGLVYCMAGGYGVRFIGLWDLPNPIGVSASLAVIARWVHAVSAFALLLPLGLHLGLVLGHHFHLRDRLIARMLPQRADRADQRVDG